MTGGSRAGSRSPAGVRRPLAAAFVPSLLLLIPMARGRVWFHGDLAYYFYGLRGLLRGAWHSGIPAWSPFVSCGIPLLGDIQLAPFYPPNLVFYFFPPGLAFSLYFTGHFLLGTYLAWRYFRHGGHAPWPAATGTLVFVWSGFFWVHLHHPTFLGAGIWLPGMLEAWDDITGRRRPLPAAASTLAFMVAMAALAGGSPQILYYELIVATAYAAFSFRHHSTRKGTGWWRRALAGAGATGLGLGIAAVQLVPGLAAVRDRYPSVLPPVDYAASFALSPPALLRLLVPNVFGNDFHALAGHGYQGPSTYWESWVYFGVLTLPLMALAAGKRGRRGFFTALFGFSMLAGLGKFGGIHWLLVYLVPFYAKFRAPSRWIMIAGFAAAALAAEGLERLTRHARKNTGMHGFLVTNRSTARVPETAPPPGCDPLPDLHRVALVTLVLGVEVWALCGLVVFRRDVPLHPVAAAGWLLALVNVFAAWAYLKWTARAMRSSRLRGRVGPLAAGLLLLDLLPILATYNHTVPASVPRETPALVTAIRERAGHDRVLLDRSAPLYLLNGGNEFGYRGVRGYNPLNPARVVRLLEAADGSPPREGGISMLVNRVTSPVLDGPAARLLVTRKARPSPWLRERYRDPTRQVRIYENLRALPRAFLTDRIVRADTPEQALAQSLAVLERRAQEADTRCAGPGVIADSQCARSIPPPPGVIEAPAPLSPRLTGDGAATAAVRWDHDGMDTVRLEVNTAAPALLVLADTFAPGWTATLDGRDVPIYPAYHAFRGVMIPSAGQHVVQFRYHPPGFVWGAWLSLLCLATWGVTRAVARSGRMLRG